MRRSVTIILSLIVLIAIHVTVLEKTEVARKELPRGDRELMVLPSQLQRLTALEFKGLVADLLFIETIVYYGSTLNRTERPYVKDWEWQWFEKMLNATTDLDPYFFDPYFFGNAIFSWESRKIKEANTLLEKGSSHRTWDWMLPFFAGFNYFFFLQENGKAADYLMEASRRPGANPLLASLASKLAYKENLTETSIQFLEEVIRRTDDERIKEQLDTRITTLKRIFFLEQAVAMYRQKYRQTPSKLELLVAKSIINKIPIDPYGGKFYINAQGEVKTTSEHLLIPYNK